MEQSIFWRSCDLGALDTRRLRRVTQWEMPLVRLSQFKCMLRQCQGSVAQTKAAYNSLNLKKEL